MAAIYWRNAATCQRFDGEMWFPAGSDVDTSFARQLCLGCPVRWDCGTVALEAGESEGIWAGYWLKHKREREALERALPGVVARAPHGVCSECGRDYVPNASDTGRCRPCVRGLVPAAPVRDYVGQLHEWLPWRQIAAMSGLSLNTVQSLMNHPREYMSRETADALMSIPPLAVMP
ncbi:WhiB family transcriptional regulator [Micromonospora sp. NPDC048169]|uniref:WhiB family transcriptional regulator n=1 Tax=Micromonospora sp. NPDC048169 TaxID=3154711 RepID=UPI0033E48775